MWPIFFIGITKLEKKNVILGPNHDKTIICYPNWQIQTLGKERRGGGGGGRLVTTIHCIPDMHNICHLIFMVHLLVLLGFLVLNEVKGPPKWGHFCGVISPNKMLEISHPSLFALLLFMLRFANPPSPPPNALLFFFFFFFFFGCLVVFAVSTLHSFLWPFSLSVSFPTPREVCSFFLLLPLLSRSQLSFCCWKQSFSSVFFHRSSRFVSENCARKCY